jgi:hypothetical protein
MANFDAPRVTIHDYFKCMFIMDGQDQTLNNKIIFIQNLHNATWWILVSSSGTITSHWNLRAWIFSTFKIIILKLPKFQTCGK